MTEGHWAGGMAAFLRKFLGQRLPEAIELNARFCWTLMTAFDVEGFRAALSLCSVQSLILILNCLVLFKVILAPEKALRIQKQMGRNTMSAVA